MRVAYIIDHLRGDGTQNALCQLTEGLSFIGYDQTVICLSNSWDGAVRMRLTNAKVRVIIVGKGALLCGWGPLKIYRQLRYGNYEVVVTMLFVSDVLGRTIGHLSGISKVISTIRARNIGYSFWQLFLLRRSMKWADRVVLNSREVVDFAVQMEGVDPCKIAIIPNGIDSRVFGKKEDCSRLPLRFELGISADAILIGSIGRLHKQKGYDVLLTALSHVKYQNWHLILIGIGPEKDRLQKQAGHLRISERVHFLGYRNDIPFILGMLDLYVQPSRFEGMPNALMEAMAAGLPVIACQVDGIAELLPNQLLGWRIPPDDAEKLSSAIQEACEKRLQAALRGQNARRWIEKNFSVNHMIQEWNNILTSTRSTFDKTAS